MVRFRTLGCYPLTAGIESSATTLDEIVAETLGATTSERQGRIIDHDGGPGVGFGFSPVGVTRKNISSSTIGVEPPMSLKPPARKRTVTTPSADGVPVIA